MHGVGNKAVYQTTMQNKQCQPNPVQNARFFKDFWKSPRKNLKISAIKFGVFSSSDIDQLSTTQITSPSTYDTSTLEPKLNGPLDPRLGLSSSTDRNSNNNKCVSCNLSSKQCVGHFGHIDLVLPCFHIGYIKDVIQILRMICKSCSKILLSPNSSNDDENPNFWRKRMSKASMSRGEYNLYFKKIIEVCKKKRKCPYCGELNGAIKKHAKSFRILHEKYRVIQDNNNNTERISLENESTFSYFGLFDNILDHEFLHCNNKQLIDFKRSVSLNVTEDLMPWDIYELFSNIDPSDYILIGLRFAAHCPQDLILTKLPVPPCILRPGTKLQDDKANDDDLTAQLAKIIQSNNLIIESQERGENICKIIENFFFLNKKISEYFISDLPGYPAGNISSKIKGNQSSKGRGGLAGTRSVGKTKKIRSFSDRLKGKFGRFRGNLSGKRVNFSGRTVISPDPNLELDELGVPVDVCKLLTFGEMVTKHNINIIRKLILNGPDKYPGAITYNQRINNNDNNNTHFKSISLKKLKFRKNIIQNLLKYGDKIERHLINGDIVLFNRQPSLHRVSIMSHRVKCVPFRTFRFNPCCCNPYNADFDGDEMNIHAPQTLMARAEAKILMNVSANFMAPKSAQPLVVPLQDIITSSYLLTLKRMFFDYNQLIQLIGFMNDCLFSNISDIPLPAIYKPIKLWTGKQVFSMLLLPTIINLESEGRNYRTNKKWMDPNDGYIVIRNSELLCGNIDKNILGSTTSGLFFRMLRDYGCQETAKCMNRLSKLSTRFLQLYGFSIGISDVTATDELKSVQDKLIQIGYSKCNEFLKSFNQNTLTSAPGCNLLETLESKMNSTLSQIREDAGKQCIAKLSYYYNAPLIMAECGSKGSKINISQMVACVGQQTVSGSRVKNQFIHRTLPHFEINSKTPGAKGFVENSFFTGITATEFFFHTMGGREGLVDTAVKTAETGYMQRRLMKNIEDISISYDYTVRNCKKQIVQFFFGNDGIDPMYCESDKNVINFHSILKNIRSKRIKNNNNDDPILSPQNILNAAKKIIFSYIGSKLNFVRRNITYFNKKCELQFEYSLLSFITESIYNIASCYYNKHGFDIWYAQLYGYRYSEISELVYKSTDLYISCIMEPGSAVGGVSATSLGEPATQMTLKTFHFAGVASMNITQGVPRIKEIINATPNMKTPIMTMQLEINDNPDIAKIIKSRIDITLLGTICKSMILTIRPQKAYIECVLDLNIINKLHLEMTNSEIGEIIIKNLKKILPRIPGHRILASYIRVATKNRDLIRVQPRGEYIDCSILGIILNHLLNNLQNIKICGITKVNRALIHLQKDDIKCSDLNKLTIKNRLFFDKKDDDIYDEAVEILNIDKKHELIDFSVIKTRKSYQNIPISKLKKPRYQLYVEGKECFLNVLNISGIKATQSVSNDIIEVCNILGIEAATKTIINELTSVYSSHGLKVDRRHLMLIADLMTYTGKVLGFSRHGMMGKEDKSILTMASYEETVKHLFQAALHGEKTKICGVSDSIIVGTPIPIGTGACSVLRDIDRKSLFDQHEDDNDHQYLPKRKELLLGQCPQKAMMNNDIIVVTK